MKPGLLILLMLFNLFAHTQDGVLDNTFGTNGIGVVLVAPNGATTTTPSDLSKMIVQPDGKILQVGYKDGVTQNDFILIRYNADGTPDATFGTQVGEGWTVTDLGGNDRAHGVALQSDGKIVVAGETTTAGGKNIIAVVRYNANGILDNTFGTGGIVKTDLNANPCGAYTVKLIRHPGLGENFINVGGWGRSGATNDFVLIQYEYDGTRRASFGTNGVVFTDFAAGDDRITDIVLLGSNVLAGGWARSGAIDVFAMALYNGFDGTLEASFGTSGKVVGNFSAQGRSLAIDRNSSNKIYLTGPSNNTGVYQFTTASYNSNGTLNTSFGGTGIVRTDVGTLSIDYSRSVLVQCDGKVLVGGEMKNGTNPYNYAIVRYTSAGVLDNTFNSTGKFFVNTGDVSNDYGFSGLAQQENGKILLSGVSFTAASSYVRFHPTVIRINNPSLILPTPIITPANPILCLGGETTLTASGGTTYEWTIDGWPYSSTASTLVLSYPATVSVKVKNGNCVGLASDPVTITEVTGPTATLSPLSGNLCTSSQITLTANTTGTIYQWRRNGNIIPSVNLQTYTASTAGTYTVTASDGNCFGNPSNGVVITGFPVAPLLGGTGVHCDGASVNVGIPITQNDQDYRWRQNGTGAHYVPTGGGGGNQSLQFLMEASRAGEYRVESNKPGCPTVYSNYVYVGYPQINDLVATNICANEVTFKWNRVLPAFVSQNYEYEVSLSSTPSAVIFPTTSDSMITVSSLLPGTEYFIHVRSLCGFGSTTGNWATISFITPATNPSGSITPVSAVICPNGSQLLTTSGGNSYQWFRDGNAIFGAVGSTYTATAVGIYTVNIINGSCAVPASNQSLITLNPSLTSTTNVSVCNNLLPFTWNGNSYNSAGSFNVTLISQAGCDSIATLNLTIKPLSTSTTNASICSNQLPYNWNGNNYSIAGTYNATLTGSNGCDSTATLNLTIKSTSASTTNATICSNLLPYNWNGNNYNAAGAFNVTLIAANGCDSIATLNLVVKSISTSTTNVSICTNQLPYNWNGNSYNSAGSYNVTLIAANGCDSIATLNLTVATVLTSTTNASVCINQLPYVWNGNNYNTAGTFNVTFVSQSGCDSIATLNLAIKPVLTSTTNAAVCSNQLPYNWNGNNYNIAGTYNATLLGSNGCDSIATLNLTIKPISTSITNASTCSNQLPYSWNGNNYNITGSYNVTLVSANGCDSIATLNLTVKSTSTSTTNASICTNQLPYSWNGNNYNAAGVYNVTLVSANGCDSVATLNLTVATVLTSTTNASVCDNQLPFVWNGNNYNTAGSFNVTFTSQSGCDSIATLNLTIKPILTSTTNASTCSNQLPYNWNGNNYNATGVYNVTLLGSNGCDSVATLNLTVKQISTSTTHAAICSNHLPYSWNGNNYNATGNYSITLISSNGCDSIATLNLIVNPVQASTTNVSICTNQLPYNWNGNNYNAAGTYNVTLIAVSGCDSIATLNLSVGLVLTSTTNISICANQLPYSWNGNNYNAAGTYTVPLVGVNGCDSIATLNLAVRPVLTSVTNAVVCSNLLPYSWNGNNYNSTGVYNVTLLGSNGCDSIASLNLTVKPVLTSVTNASRCANQLPYNWNGNNYTVTGTYNVVLIGSNGCDSIATLNLTVKPVLTSTTNVAACANQLPYSWNGNNYNSAGTYNVTLTGSNGCDSIATLNLTIKPVSASTTNISICANQLPYSWNGNSYNTAGNYNVTLTAANSCDSVATLILLVNSLPTGSISPGNTTICAGASQVLTVTGGVSYQWFINGVPVNGATTELLTATAQGVYTAQITSANGCKAMASNAVNIQVLQKPIAAFSYSALCQNEVRTFSNTSVAGNSGTVNWSWNFGDNSTSLLFAPTHTYNQPGTYTITLIATPAACQQLADTIKKTITVIAAIPGIRYDNARVIKNIANTLSARNVGVQYLWQPATALSNPAIQNPVITTSVDREYLIRIRTAAGCLITDTLLVQAFDKANVFVPKAFTPNSNNANDKLRPLGVSIGSIDYFRVYNRWGQLMYETQKVGEGWDGNYKNVPQPTETYSWVFAGKSSDGTIIKASGKTVLIR